MARRKTEGVNFLVQDVLATFNRPYSEDVIEDVCLAIEANPEWQRRYDQLTHELNTHEVNKAIGRYVKAQTGLSSVIQVEAKRAEIIGSYTKLQ